MQCSAIYDATLLVLKNAEEKQGKYEEYEGGEKLSFECFLHSITPG